MVLNIYMYYLRKHMYIIAKQCCNNIIKRYDLHLNTAISQH